MIIICPHCREYIDIEEINCGIFRHGVLISNRQQIHPHSSEELCNFYITNNKIKDFNYVVFEPEFTYYFFGIKIISLDYNLKYRAMRNYPKNIADIIITKYKLNIDVPKIKKLEDKINANNERIYDKKDFIETILKYLKKFNFNKFNINQLKIELDELSN